MAAIAAFIFNAAGSPQNAPTALAERVPTSSVDVKSHVAMTNVLASGAVASLTPPAVGYATSG